MSSYVAKTYGFCQKPQPGDINEDQVELWADAIRVMVLERRKAIGLSQEETAQKIGVSRQTLSAFENKKNAGISDIGFNKVLRLCLLLNIDIFAEAPEEYNDFRYYDLQERLRDLAYNFG